LGSNKKIFICGGIIGLIAAILMKFGNPANMGICIACFYRDIAGALGLHGAETVRYIRPEIIGFIFGGFIAASLKGEFRSRGGSSPIIRFVLSVFLMFGALVFLGCPLRMILRLANGDLNALIGLIGYVFGIFIGIQFIKKGYSLGRSFNQTKISGYVIPIFAIILLIFLIVKPSFISFSTEGPGSMRAPIILSLILGIIVGLILQRSRICTAGGFRDVLLIKDYHFLWGIIGIFIFNLVGNLILNFDTFHIGFANQPIAHTESLWNFLGMSLVGICSIFLGGCPLRQTILASEGDTDSGITVFGLIVGAALAHNFQIAASPKGVPFNGKLAVIIGFIVVLFIGYSVIKNVQGQERVSKEVEKNA